MIVACADSRVDPATIFSAAPGELFVVRNVAALVPPYEEQGAYHGTSAALEFAVTVLGVASIVVLGHGLCGGVAAALAAAERKPAGRFIGPWVELLAGVREELLRDAPVQDPAERQQTMEQMAIEHSLQNLMSFPFVAERMAQGSLALEGAWFSIAQGELRWLDQDTGRLNFCAKSVALPGVRPFSVGNQQSAVELVHARYYWHCHSLWERIYCHDRPRHPHRYWHPRFRGDWPGARPRFRYDRDYERYQYDRW
jgi:carbonic anhydrase